MQIPCDHAANLVPSYLDGELTEAQAAPLRAHLLSCLACRETAKAGKSLKGWFVEASAPEIPTGFAARVARRAFAGDPGETTSPMEPHEAGASAAREEAVILPFVLRMTVAAAAVLLIFAAAMQLQSRPTDSNELRADDLDAIWEEIYGMDTPAGVSPERLDGFHELETADDEQAAPARR